MKPVINVNATSVDERRFFARIEGKDLQQIVAEAVAKAAGIDLDGCGVRVDHCWITTKDSSTGHVPTAEVVIVQDRSMLPQAAK